MKSQNAQKIYRAGAIGALIDEYERAAREFKNLIERIPEPEFERIVDARTQREECRSIQTIMSHVVSAGYGYADYLRQAFSIQSNRPPKTLLSHRESLKQLGAMLAYTDETLRDRYEMSHEEMSSAVIHSSWGVTYNVEQLLEHAVVHVLRHRRQIEKFSLNFQMNYGSK